MSGLLKDALIFTMGICLGVLIFIVIIVSRGRSSKPTLEQRVRELEARVRVLEGKSKSTNFYMPVDLGTYGTKQTT